MSTPPEASEGDGSFFLDKWVTKSNRWKVTPNMRITNMDYELITKSMEILRENDVPFFIEERSIKNGICYNIAVRGYKRMSRLLKILTNDMFCGKNNQKLVIIKKLVEYRLLKLGGNANSGIDDYEKQIYTEYDVLRRLVSKGKRNLKAPTTKG